MTDRAQGPTQAAEAGAAPTFPCAQLLGVVALAAWLVFGRPPDHTVWWDAVFDVGHVALFAVATALVLDMVARWAPRLSGPAALGVTIAVIAGCAVLSELGQIPDPARHASVGDVLRDLAGAGLYLGALVATARVTRRRLAATWALVAVGVVALGAVPLSNTAGLYRERDRLFPTVLTFDRLGWARQFVLTSAIEPASCAARAQAEGWCVDTTPVTFYPDVFAGYEVQEVVSDWSGYDYLTLCVGVPADAVSVPLVLRLQDERLARLGRQGPEQVWQLAPGMHTVAVPLASFTTPGGPPLRRDRMRRLAVFIRQAPRPQRLYLGSVGLTRDLGGPCTHDVDGL